MLLIVKFVVLSLVSVLSPAGCCALLAAYVDAFKTQFKSLNEILNRLDLEYSQVVDLPWKEEKMNELIFTMDYDKYWKHWQRLWLVAGNREPIRPYCLRVGAGSSLNGKCVIPLLSLPQK